MTYKPKCVGEGKVHNPQYYIKLYQLEDGGTEGEGIAFLWCQECGAAAVNYERDGRFAGRLVNPKYPSLLEKIVASESKAPEAPEPEKKN